MSKEFRTDRFTSGPGELQVFFPSDLKAEFDNNLQKMADKELSNEQFVQLSERNIEIQKLLYSNKYNN